jgi:hypothetical protein
MGPILGSLCDAEPIYDRKVVGIQDPGRECLRLNHHKLVLFLPHYFLDEEIRIRFYRFRKFSKKKTYELLIVSTNAERAQISRVVHALPLLSPVGHLNIQHLPMRPALLNHLGPGEQKAPQVLNTEIERAVDELAAHMLLAQTARYFHS